MTGGATATAPAFATSWDPTPDVVAALVAGVVGATPVGPALAVRLRPRDPLAGDAGAVPALAPAASLAAVALCAVLFVVSVLLSAAGTYSPFIYFRF